MLKQYRVILFDLDGTLTDPKEGITKSAAYALHRLGIEVENPDDLCCFIGPPLIDSFQEYCGLARSQAELAVQYYRERFREKGVFENLLLGGVPPMLQDLKKQGKRLAVASSKPEVFAKQIAEYFEIAPYFDFICGCGLDGARNTKAEVIAYALKKLGSPSRDSVVMVGDRKHDIIGARENGIDSIGVLVGYGSREELEAAGASEIAATIEQLHTMLEG